MCVTPINGCDIATIVRNLVESNRIYGRIILMFWKSGFIAQSPINNISHPHNYHTHRYINRTSHRAMYYYVDGITILASRTKYIWSSIRGDRMAEMQLKPTSAAFD